MPANKKHLTQSPWQRLCKIIAGFVGGYIITEALHMLLILCIGTGNTLITIRYVGFIIWAVLLILAFCIKNGYKALGLYALIALILSGLVYVCTTNNLFL